MHTYKQTYKHTKIAIQSTKIGACSGLPQLVHILSFLQREIGLVALPRKSATTGHHSSPQELHTAKNIAQLKQPMEW